MSPDVRLAVLIVCDRLSVCGLGCYGNDWIETPTLDEIAAAGATFDQAYLDCIPLDDAASALGQSLAHSLNGRPIAVTQFTEAGVAGSWAASEIAFPGESAISGDESGLAARPNRLAWARVVQRARGWLSESFADNAATGRLNHADSSGGPGVHQRLLVLRATGIPEPWLPPRDFATFYFDEFLERGWSFAADDESTWGTAWSVYGGAVSLFDQLLAPLWQDLQQLSRTVPTCLALTSLRGNAIPALSPVDSNDDHWPLHQLRVPLLLWQRSPDGCASDSPRISTMSEIEVAAPSPKTTVETSASVPASDGAPARVQPWEWAASRRRQLVQPSDLPQALVSWLEPAGLVATNRAAQPTDWASDLWDFLRRPDAMGRSHRVWWQPSGVSVLLPEAFCAAVPAAADLDELPTTAESPADPGADRDWAWSVYRQPEDFWQVFDAASLEPATIATAESLLKSAAPSAT